MGLPTLTRAAADRRYSPALGPFPTLLASFDGDDLGPAAGSQVLRWADRSGKGQNLVQATSANRPTVEVEGGRKHVYCATSQYLAASGFGNSAWGQPSSYAQPVTFCAVVKASTGAAAFRTLIGGTTAVTSLAVGLGVTDGIPVLTGGNGATQTVGVKGGPSLNDATWHAVVAVFDTTRAYIMVDGYLVGTIATQSHGTATLVKLAVGAFADGTLNSQGARFRRVDVYGGALQPVQAQAWTAQMMARWGLGTPAPQSVVDFQDITDSGSQGVRVFLPPTVGASVPVAIFNHQQAGTTGVDPAYWAYTAIHALVSRGIAVTYSNNHGTDSWSNDNAENDVANARAWINTNVAPVSGSMLVGISMGGALSMIAAKDSKISDLRGVYLIDPAVNLQAMYTNGYSGSLNTAFGITQATDIPVGKDPATLTGGQLPQNIRWRAVASSADTIAVKANNIDVVAPIIQAASPTEYALVTHLDGHASRGASLPADIDAFARRCFGL